MKQTKSKLKTRISTHAHQKGMTILHFSEINLKTKSILHHSRYKGMIANQDFKLHCPVFILNCIHLINHCLYFWPVLIQDYLNNTSTSNIRIKPIIDY